MKRLNFFKELKILSRRLEAIPGIWKAFTEFMEPGMMRINGIKYYCYLLTQEYGPGGTHNEPGSLELVDDEDTVNTILTS
jgi:hypothetical protein